MKLEAYKIFIIIVVLINYIVLLILRLAWIWLREMIDDLKRLDSNWTKLFSRDPGSCLDNQDPENPKQ